MPCAAGSRCTAVADNTPGPPHFTNHPCKACGKYLHGTCGVVDPLGESEMHRVCHNCESSRCRKTSGAGTAGGRSEKRDSSQGKGKCPAGTSSAARLGQPVAKKPGGAPKRKRVSNEEKVNALDLLETRSVAAVAAKMGTGESTIYNWKSEAIVADMGEDLCDENLVQMDLVSDDDVDETEQGEAGQSSGAAAPLPPPYSGVAEHFCELEDTAEKCGMPVVSYHLRKAKLAWMSSYGSRETKQTSMADFL